MMSLTGRLFSVVCVALLGPFFAPKKALAETQDYLTAEEVESLRDAQEPDLRLKLLLQLLEDRLDKAKALKDPGAIRIKASEASQKPTEKKKKERKQEVPRPEKSKPAAPASSKPFADWMQQYLQCLDELAANLENFRTMPKAPKAYLKSLNKIEEALQEQNQWITHVKAGQLDRREREVVEEIVIALGDVTEDVQSAVSDTEEQIRLLKEAEKSKASRR